MPDSSDPQYDLDATIPVSKPQGSIPRQDAPELPLLEELSALLPKGDYTVEGFLGQGGMGAVYRATQVRLQRPVAIKIMRRDQGRDHGFEERFRREALAMAKLNHPNIVSVIDYGEAGADYLYIVMELVEGADLMDVIRTGRMTQEMALALLPQICDALQFAHDHGIVHRDIKPSNIMLTRDGRVKMADFGLAKHYDAESSFRTHSGTGMGTPDYAAPEQFDGTGQIDHRADIYALGVMIYQMITGQLPRGVWKPPSQRAEVNPKWDEIVGHAMQNDPADRYQAASEIKTDVSLIGSASAAPGAEAKLPAASVVAAPVAASHGDAPQGGRRQAVRQVAPPRAQPSAAPVRKSSPVAAVILGLIALVSFYLTSVYWSRIRNSAADTTPTADTALVPVTSVADGSIDLLALADVAKDAEGGIWKREGTDLSGADDPTARRSLGSRLGLALPVRVEGSYRLEVEFTKRGRKESVSVILPLNGERSVVANFQESSDFAGLVEVRGMSLKEAGNPTRVPNALNNEQRYRAAVEVRLKGDQADITATLEGKPLFRYQGPIADLDSRRYAMADPARPGIKSMDPVTWHRVRIASLDGGKITPARDDVILPGASGAATAPKQLPLVKPINLLTLVDVKRDALMEPWTLENGALRSPQGINRKEEGAGTHQTMVFSTPHPSANYDLRYRLTRNTRGAAVAFVFEQNGSTVDLRMDGGHGICIMPSRKSRENKEKQWLPPGETHEILIEVREDRVRVSVDGVLELEQEGTQLDDLRRNDAFYPLEKVKRPFIGIGVCGGDITVHSAELREVDKNSRQESSTTSAK